MNDFAQETAPAEQSPVVETPEAPEAAPETPRSEPVSRREALEKAFAEVDAPKAKEAPKAAEEGPQRGPDGKFAPKGDTAEAKNAPQEQPQKAPTLSEPPSRFSPDAKAAWSQAPEAVRGEINRAIQEMERGLAEKDQDLKPLKPYIDAARQHGTTVPEALDRYMRIEGLLASDPKRGMEVLAQNMGKTLQQFIAEVSGGPQQPAQPETAKDREIVALKQELQQLRGEFGQVSQTVQQQQLSSLTQQIDQFAAERPRFDELANEIARLIETGYATDLADAYEKAERLNPAPQAASAAPPAPAQTRQPQSVTGAPSAGSNPGQRKPSENRQQALSRAFSAVGLA